MNITYITEMMRVTGCNEATAEAYLDAEQWDIYDAIASYQADQQAQRSN